MDRSRIATFKARMAEVKATRRMFRSGKHYIGMGSKSVEVGDQIWLLRGANVPFILRRAGNGNGNYRLIGEAYVHGIMHGEAMEGRLGSVQPIIIE